MSDNPQDPFIPVVFPHVQQDNREVIRREIKEDHYKIALVLMEGLKAMTNRWDTNVHIEEKDGGHVITFSNKLNALQLNVQNALQHYHDNVFGQALLNLFKGYRIHAPEFYANLAYDIINDRNDSRIEDENPEIELTAENVELFARWLSDSDSLFDSMWHAASNELDYFLEVQAEEAEPNG